MVPRDFFIELIISSEDFPISTKKVLDSMNIQHEKISINYINNIDCFKHDQELKKLV